MGYIQDIRRFIGHERLIIVGATVIAEKEDKILFQKRRDNGCWGLPGGCLELGETVEEAVARELTEETGLVALELKFFHVFSGKELFYTYPNGDMVAVTDVVFMCHEFSGELVKENDETAELRWFHINDLPENISPPQKPSVKLYLERVKGVSMQ